MGQVVKTVNDLASQKINQDDSLIKEVQVKSVRSLPPKRRSEADLDCRLDQMTERLQALSTRAQSPTLATEKFEETLERSIAS